MTRRYEQDHCFHVVRVEGRPSPLIDHAEESFKTMFPSLRDKEVSLNKQYVITAGPVFPAFIAADFKSLGGFLDFADSYGYDWLATVGPGIPEEKPLSTYLRDEFEIPAPGELAPATDSLDKQVSQPRKEVPIDYLESYHTALTTSDRASEKPATTRETEDWRKIDETINKIGGELGQHQKRMREIYEAAISPVGRVRDDVPLKLGPAARHEPMYVHPSFHDLKALETEIKYELGMLSRNQKHALELDLDIKTDGTVNLTYRPLTLLARCWLEIIEIINDVASGKIKLKPCENCGLLFIPGGNAKYCDRLAPRQRQHPGKTCKDVGAQAMYRRTLGEDLEKAEIVREKNRLNQAKSRARKRDLINRAVERLRTSEGEAEKWIKEQRSKGLSYEQIEDELKKTKKKKGGK